MDPDWLRPYDALWRELRAIKAACGVLARGRQPRTQVRTREEVVAAMASHSARASAYYANLDPYRAALWGRRAYLHRTGRTGEVYDGADARAWHRAHEAGRTRHDAP